MIARLWQGVVPAEREAAYEAFLERAVLPEYRGTPGNLGVTVLRRAEGARVRFLIISRWDAEASVRAFAGDDVERAHYQPEALRYLIDPEPYAVHYEVRHEAPAPSNAPSLAARDRRA